MEKFILVMLFMLGVTNAEINNSQYINVERYDIYNGLSSNNISEVVQDDFGYLWLATHNGLNRFDGESFQWFLHDPNVLHSIPSNQISLFHVHKNHMWLALNEMGLARMDLESHEFKLFEVDPSGHPNALLSDVIFAISHDQQGRIWAFQFEKGISVFDPQTGEFEHLKKNSHPWLTSLRFFDAKIGPEGKLWIATLDGVIFEVDTANKTAKTHAVEYDAQQPKTGRVYHLAFDDHGGVYAATGNGLHRYDTATDEWQILVNNHHTMEVLGEAVAIRQITIHHNQVWMSTRSGLLLLEDNQLSHVQFMERGQPLKDILHIRSVFTDQDEGVWVATDQAGLFKLSNRWSEITIKKPDVLSQLSQTKVSSALGHNLVFAEDESTRKLWIGQYQRGNWNTLRTYDEQNNVPNQINQIYQDRLFRLWLASAQGLFLLDPISQQFNLVDNPLGISGINQIFEVENMLWLTTYGGEHWYQVTGSDQPKIEQIDHAKPWNTVINEVINDIDSRLWIYGNRGLEVIDPVDLSHQVLLNSERGLSDLFYDRKEGLVVVLSLGDMAQYRLEEGQLIPVDSQVINTSLAGKFVTSVTRDGSGTWWFGSKNGLIQRSEQGTLNLTVANGLPMNDVQDILTMHDGQILASTGAGWVQWKTKASQSPRTPELVINRVAVNNQPSTESLFLPHQYGVLDVRFRLDTLTENSQNQFQYRLSEHHNWQNVNHPQLSFYQLPPADYELQIRGQVNQGPWSDIQSISFHVALPFWQSNKAYWLYSIALLFLIIITWWGMRQRWQYRSKIKTATEKLQFAQTQVTVNRALVDTMNMEQLFSLLKQHIEVFLPDCKIEVAYWDSETQFESFSHEAISKQDKLYLGKKAYEMYQNDLGYLLGSNQSNYELLIGYHLSPSQIGLLQIKRQRCFEQQEILQAQAFASQLTVTIEHNQLFSEVQKLAKKAQAASQAKSDFLAQVSHEVRTPMHGILGMNQLLSDSNLNDVQIKYVNAISESGHHLLHIINDILDYSKIEAGQLKLESRPFDLFCWVDELLMTFMPQAHKKGLLFYLDISPNLVRWRYGDPIRLKQIVLNLLGNAFKFTIHGSVSLILRPGQYQNKLQIEVKDTGTGIPAKNIDTLFDPFTQADSSTTRKFGGTGLGLGIVKQLCELMTGHVGIESKEGLGTSVICELTLEIDESAKKPVMFSRLVKLVADNTDIETTLINQLTVMGMQVTTEDSNMSFDLMILAINQLSPNDKVMIDAANRELKSVYWVNVNSQSPPKQISSKHILSFPPLFKDLQKLIDSQSDDLKPSTTTNDQLRTLNTLVLEDNPLNQELMNICLTKSGHRVTILAHAHDALDQLKQGIHYDVILVDYHLPEMNGLDFIIEARKHLPDVPYIMMSADVSDQLYHLCQQHQIKEVLSKPIDIKFLEQQLSALS